MANSESIGEKNGTSEKVRYRSTFYHQGKRYEATGKSQEEADKKATVKKEQLNDFVDECKNGIPEKVRYRSTFYHQGKRYEATGKSQKEADQKAAIKKDKLKRGEVGISGNMTVGRWAMEWFETYKKPSIGKSHSERYISFINHIIVPAIGSILLKNVKDVHLQKILNERVGKSKSDLSKLRMTINEMFLRAYKSNLISFNPAEDLVLPAATEGSHRSITDNERKKILEVASEHYAGLWIKTMLYCGLRPGETRALDWRHVNFDKPQSRPPAPAPVKSARSDAERSFRH